MRTLNGMARWKRNGTEDFLLCWKQVRMHYRSGSLYVECSVWSQTKTANPSIWGNGNSLLLARIFLAQVVLYWLCGKLFYLCLSSACGFNQPLQKWVWAVRDNMRTKYVQSIDRSLNFLNIKSLDLNCFVRLIRVLEQANQFDLSEVWLIRVWLIRFKISHTKNKSGREKQTASSYRKFDLSVFD